VSTLVSSGSPRSRATLIGVAVLIAVMIWRVMQSSAKLRNEVSLSARKSRTAL